MVKLYGKSLCGGCEQAKQYLTANNIEFEYCPIDHSDNKTRIEYKRELMRVGAQYIPVLVYDKEMEVVLIGFDKDKYDDLFGVVTL